MKLHTPPKPIEIVRLTIRKQGFNYEYIMLDDATIEEAEKFVRITIQNKIKIDPFYTGKRIAIDIRRYEGAKAGKSRSISFKHEITPKELKSIILKELQS